MRPSVAMIVASVLCIYTFQAFAYGDPALASPYFPGGESPKICGQMCIRHGYSKKQIECEAHCAFDPPLDSAHDSLEKFVMDKIKTYEGNIPYMYLDVNGNVTVGVGNLLSTVADAQALPFYKNDGTAATDVDIKKAFNIVAGSSYGQMVVASDFESLTTIRMKQDDIDKLANNRLSEFKKELRSAYPNFDEYPAKVKAALFDMIFNLGSKKLAKFSKMNTAIGVQDWQDAAEESRRMPPVPEQRNDYVKGLLEAAAKEVLDAKSRLSRCLGGGSSPIFPLSDRRGYLPQRGASVNGNIDKLHVYHPE